MELVRSKKPTTFPVHPVSCWTRHAQRDLIQTLLWQNRILKGGQLLPWSKRGEREDGVWPSARGAWAQALSPRDPGSRLRIWLSVPVPTPSGCRKRRSIPGRGTKILQAKKIKRQIKFSSVRLHEQERTQLWEIKPVYLERILSRKRCFLDPRGHRPLCQVHIVCIGTGLTSAESRSQLIPRAQLNPGSLSALGSGPSWPSDLACDAPPSLSHHWFLLRAGFLSW